MGMSYDRFFDGIEEIFAAFGKKMPEDRVVQAIYKRVRSLPDGFMDFAVRHFEDEEQLPKNMGHYLLRDLWPEYLSRNPDLKSHEYARCEKCDPNLPGWRKVYAQETTGWGESFLTPVIVRCACGNAPNPNHERVYSDCELEDAGLAFSLPYDPGFEVFKKKWLEKEAEEDTKAEPQNDFLPNQSSAWHSVAEMPF